MPHRAGGLLALVVCLFAPAAAPAEPRLELITDQVPLPTYAAHAGDDRIFIAERAGRIWIHDGAALLPEPYLDASAAVSVAGEGGLASFAFHPDHARNGQVFLFFTEPLPPFGQAIVVTRFTASAADPNRADAGSRRDLLRLAKLSNFHHGGQLQFGPDGYLYVSLGDGGPAYDPACNAQHTGQLFGKLLRLDVDVADDAEPGYAIPPSNPFADPLDGVADEIWASGLRNPFRFSFDRSSGALWLGDVGQDAREEIDRQPAGSRGGENYGWKVQEGSHCVLPETPVGGGCPPSTPPCGDPAYTPPVYEYGRVPEVAAAVTGGSVYRGTASPAYQGRYVFADSFLGRIFVLSRTAPYEADALGTLDVVGPVAITEDRHGELLVVEFFAGRVSRLVLPAEPAAPDAACLVEVNRASARLARAAARAVRACVRAGARGRLGGGGIEACAEAPPSRAVARRLVRLVEADGTHCAPEPHPFTYAGVADAAPAASASGRELAHAVFGPELDAAFAEPGDAASVQGCQQDVHRALDACQDARRAEWLRCQRLGLRDGGIASLAELAACLDADPNGRIQRACGAPGGKLARTFEQSCDVPGAALAAAFPGCAGPFSGSGRVLACIESASRCRHCRLVDAVNALGVSCDRFDDGAVNLSCAPLE